MSNKEWSCLDGCGWRTYETEGKKKPGKCPSCGGKVAED